MHPFLFEQTPCAIPSQAALMIVAFIAGLALSIHAGRQFGLPQNAVTDAAMWGFLASFIGARLFMIGVEFLQGSFLLDKNHFVRLFEGGYSFHGGLFAGGIAAMLAARSHRLALPRMADAFAPGLAAALFFLRVGCLLNGCDYGIAASVPWALPFDGVFRHPIQLYEGIGNLALTPVLMRLNRKPLRPGRLFALYILASSSLRLGVDMYRDDALRWGGLTLPQYLAAGLAVAAGCCLLRKR